MQGSKTSRYNQKHPADLMPVCIDTATNASRLSNWKSSSPKGCHGNGLVGSCWQQACVFWESLGIHSQKTDCLDLSAAWQTRLVSAARSPWAEQSRLTHCSYELASTNQKCRVRTSQTRRQGNGSPHLHEYRLRQWSRPRSVYRHQTPVLWPC